MSAFGGAGHSSSALLPMALPDAPCNASSLMSTMKPYLVDSQTIGPVFSTYKDVVVPRSAQTLRMLKLITVYQA
jgi:hypothetical protein